MANTDKYNPRKRRSSIISKCETKKFENCWYINSTRILPYLNSHFSSFNFLLAKTTQLLILCKLKAQVMTFPLLIVPNLYLLINCASVFPSSGYLPLTYLVNQNKTRSYCLPVLLPEFMSYFISSMPSCSGFLTTYHTF